MRLSFKIHTELSQKQMAIVEELSYHTSKLYGNSELSKFIDAYKSASWGMLKREYTTIREKLWKESFWSKSYCLLTAGGAPVEVIRKYIESQGD